MLWQEFHNLAHREFEFSVEFLSHVYIYLQYNQMPRVLDDQSSKTLTSRPQTSQSSDLSCTQCARKSIGCSEKKEDEEEEHAYLRATPFNESVFDLLMHTEQMGQTHKSSTSFRKYLHPYIHLSLSKNHRSVCDCSILRSEKPAWLVLGIKIHTIGRPFNADDV